MIQSSPGRGRPRSIGGGRGARPRVTRPLAAPWVGPENITASGVRRTQRDHVARDSIYAKCAEQANPGRREVDSWLPGAGEGRRCVWGRRPRGARFLWRVMKCSQMGCADGCLALRTHYRARNCRVGGSYLDKAKTEGVEGGRPLPLLPRRPPGGGLLPVSLLGF